jgi:hypothetical protein
MTRRRLGVSAYPGSMMRLRADADPARWVPDSSFGLRGRRHRKRAIGMLLSQANAALGATPRPGGGFAAWAMSQAAPALLHRPRACARLGVEGRPSSSSPSPRCSRRRRSAARDDADGVRRHRGLPLAASRYGRKLAVPMPPVGRARAAARHPLRRRPATRGTPATHSSRSPPSAAIASASDGRRGARRARPDPPPRRRPARRRLRDVLRLGPSADRRSSECDHEHMASSPWVPPASRAAADEGRALRKQVQGLEGFLPRAGPLGILRAQDATRVADLVPLRRARMSASPFAFYRGTAALMAADLGAGPSSGIHVASCGDAHVANFGFYASPQRTSCSISTTSTRPPGRPGSGTSSGSSRAS